MASKKKKSVKRELIEWGVFLGVIGILFITGWHKNLAAGVQQLVLKTGTMQASAKKDTEQVNAPYNFKLRTLDGKLVNFEEFKGKTVFLNLWATWCPPCIAEMPDIHKLYKEVGSDKIKFVMVSLDNEPQKAVNFIQRKGYTFPVYTAPGNLPQAYASRSIPTTFVISPKGKIVVKHKGMASYNTSKFKKLLADITNQSLSKN
ncbi:thioredoxin [marine bacterium AO1-C]|nr:thioredoxin [marine bacterium AO1-C]